MVCVFWGLTNFSRRNGFQLCPFCCRRQNLILFMAEQYSIGYTSHVFFIQPSVYGHLGWFHNFFATVKWIAMKSSVDSSIMMLTSFLLGKFPGAGQPGHRIDGFSHFWGICTLYPTIAVVCIPSTVLGCRSPHILAGMCNLKFWAMDIPTGVRWNLTWFLFAFPCCLMILGIFHVFVGHLKSVLWRMPINAFYPVFNWIVLWCLSDSSSLQVLYIHLLSVCKYFLSFCKVPNECRSFWVWHKPFCLFLCLLLLGPFPSRLCLCWCLAEFSWCFPLVI